MKTGIALSLFAVFVISAPLCSNAAIIIPTNLGIGADVEVREELGTSNRGTNVEIATRKSHVGAGGLTGNNSAFYLRFDVSGLDNALVLANPGAILRIRTRAGNNIQPNDVHAPSPVDGSDVYNSFNVRALNPSLSSGWVENSITYNTAPGITPDSNVGTEDFNSADFTLLGSFQLPNIDGQNWMQAGTPIHFNGAGLYSVVQNAVAAGHGSVTLVINMALPGLRPANGGTTPNSFLGQNYVFLSKDNLTVPADPNWDQDSSGPLPPTGSPYSNQSNLSGGFSPQLILGVPEPGSMAMAAVGLFAAFVNQRRRRRT